MAGGWPPPGWGWSGASTAWTVNAAQGSTVRFPPWSGGWSTGGMSVPTAAVPLAFRRSGAS
jgi:hypothetical protein